MTWLKKKLGKFKRCDHDYVYYNISKSYFSHSYLHTTQYHFICQKCEKTISITENDIGAVVGNLNDGYRKSRALNRTEMGTEGRFTLKRIDNISICYEGVGAKLAIEHYAKQGVDITVLY